MPDSQKSSLAEFCAYNDWARARVLEIAGGLSAGQLDRHFDIGAGSVWATLYHVFEVERFWLERCKGNSDAPAPAGISETGTIAALAAQFQGLSEEWRRLLGMLGDEGLQQQYTYESRAGGEYALTVGEMMLHAFNHGTYHRAQLMNMFRRLGAAVVNTDYVAMKREAGVRPADRLGAGRTEGK